MKTDLENELPLKPYLLGVLKPEDQQRLEQRLMIDTAAFEELQRVEDELIDDYLLGRLSGQDQDKFENFFLLPPERRQKLSFAKALKRYVAVHTRNERRLPAWLESFLAFWRFQNPVPAWSLAVALLLIVVGGFWSVVKVSRLQQELELARAPDLQKQLVEIQGRNSELAAAFEHERNQRSLLEQEVASLKAEEKPLHPSLLPGQLQSTLFSFALVPGLLRDLGSGRKINIPSGTKLVQMDLNLAPEEYSRYRAVLERVDGGEIWTQTSPRTVSAGENQPLRLILPATLLIRGDYVLKLGGITANGESEEAGKYYFRVISK